MKFFTHLPAYKLKNTMFKLIKLKYILTYFANQILRFNCNGFICSKQLFVLKSFKKKINLSEIRTYSMFSYRET